MTLISYRRLSNVTCYPDLPDHLWLRIFSYLAFEERMRICCVCRTWNRLSRDSMFWRFVDFKVLTSPKNNLVNDISVEKLISSSTAIQMVDLSGTHCQLITDHTLQYLAKCCPRLRIINLSNRLLISNYGIQAIARACPLEEITLDNCCKLGDKGISEIARCTKLTSLSVAYCFKISDKSLVKVLKKCHQLKTLNISGCTRITDKTITTLGQFSKSLNKISLKNTLDISIEAIEFLVQGVPDICHVELGILQDEVRTRAALNIIVLYCRSLRFLSFEHHHSLLATGRDTKFVPKKRLCDFVKRLSINSHFD